MIYPQFLINNTNTDVSDKSHIDAIVSVVQISDNDLVIKYDKRKYIIFNTQEYLPGDVLKVNGLFSLFKGSKNPYVFKLDQYYKRKGITSSIYVEELEKVGDFKKYLPEYLKIFI